MTKRLSKDEQSKLRAAILKHLKVEQSETVRWLAWSLNQQGRGEFTEGQVRTQLQKLAAEDKVEEKGLSNRRWWYYVTAEQRRKRREAKKARRRVEKLAQAFAEAGFNIDPEEYHGETISFGVKDLERIAKRFRLEV